MHHDFKQEKRYMMNPYHSITVCCTSFLILLTSFSYAATVIEGNNTDPSFTFTIQQHQYDYANGSFFVAADPSAHQLDQAKEFAIARLAANGQKFAPLTPKTAWVNGASNKDNPLYDAGITALSLISGDPTHGQGHPVVVKEGDPSTIYYFTDINPNGIGVLSIANVPDAMGLTTTGIVSLADATQSYAFAAVKPNGAAVSQNFGDPGSGIAVLILGVKSFEEMGKDAVQKVFELLDAPTGRGDVIPKRALPFDVTSTPVKINSDLVSMGQIVPMHWDTRLARLYIGLQAQAAGGVNDGVRSLVVGRIQPTRIIIKIENGIATTMIVPQLMLEPIAPDAAFSGAQDKIVGAVGSNAQVSIHHVNSLYTSTGLNYMVVVGNNGAPSDATRRSVFALPLVNGVSSQLNGTLANKNIDAVDVFGKELPYKFIGRAFKTAAQTAADMTTSTAPAALVGGGQLEVGDIAEIFVQEDTVFAAVEDAADNDQKTGIFYSQPIFDNTGKIIAWTNWRRVAGTTDHVFGTAFDATTGNFLSMVGTGTAHDEVNTVKRTGWGNGAQDGLKQLSNIIAQELPQVDAGVQGLFDFAPATPGVLDASFLIATGYAKVVLAQTGQVMNNVLCPTVGDAFNAMVSFDNGTITQTMPIAANNPKVISISGGVLDDIGPLVAAEIVRDDRIGVDVWLFVGGSHGVAVLSTADGSGWNSAIGLGPDFVGLTNGMSFKKFGDYQFVRKLVYDDDFLYILTDSKLDRIDVTQGNPGLGEVTPVTLATNSGFLPTYGTFSDLIVSDKLAILATSNGIMRTANNKNIRTAINELGLWEPITVPEGIGPVHQLYAVSQTGRAQDIARSDGGQLFVLQSDRSNKRSQLNRFIVRPVESTEIDEITLQPLPDFFVQDHLSFLLNYGALRLLMATDGALYMNASDRDVFISPAVRVPQRNVMPRSGNRAVGVNMLNTTLPLSIAGGSQVSALLRSFASGSWIISGDFGLQINE